MTKKELINALKFWPEDTDIQISVVTDNGEDTQDDGTTWMPIIDVEIFVSESNLCLIYTW